MANSVTWLRTMAVLNALLLLFLLIWASGPSPVVDFACYYTGAQMLRQGSPLYDLQRQLSVEKQLTGVPNLPFIHLPYELLLVVPLLPLGFKGALWAWRIFVVALVITAYKFWPSGRNWLLAAAFFPVAICIYQGQDSTLSLLIYSVSYWLLEKDRQWEAGAVLAAALYKPHLVLVIAAIFLLAGKKKFFLGFLFAGSILVAVSTALVGLRGMQDLVRMIQASQMSTVDLGVREHMMPNIRGLLVLVFRTKNVIIPTVVLSVALIAVVVRRTRQANNKQLFSLAVCTAVLCSFNLNIHDLVVLLIPMTLFSVYEARFGPIAMLSFPLIQMLFLYANAFAVTAILVGWFLWQVLRQIGRKEARAGEKLLCDVEI